MFYCECNQHSQNQITSSRLTRFSYVNAPFYGTNKKSSAKVQWNIKRHFYTVYSKSGTRSKSDYISCRLRTPPVFCLIPVTHSFTWKDFMVREFFKMSIFVISWYPYVCTVCPHQPRENPQPVEEPQKRNVGNSQGGNTRALVLIQKSANLKNPKQVEEMQKKVCLIPRRES